MSKGGFAAQVPSYTQNELGNQLAIRCINPRTQEGTCLWPNLLVHPASEHGVLSERHWPKVGEEQLGAEPSPQRLKAAHCGGGGYRESRKCDGAAGISEASNVFNSGTLIHP